MKSTTIKSEIVKKYVFGCVFVLLILCVSFKPVSSLEYSLSKTGFCVELKLLFLKVLGIGTRISDGIFLELLVFLEKF